jgi:hypothetical protein
MTKCRISTETFPKRLKASTAVMGTVMGLSMGLLLLTSRAALPQNSPPSSSSGSGEGGTQKSAASALPRGKKLMLKDGSYQLIREYQVEGDRVRYYSMDSSQWEEMPANLVDWEKTKKVEADEAKDEATAVAKVKHEEAQRQAEMLDVDASVQIAPGVFLPQGEGLYAFDGKKVLRLAQAPMTSKLSKSNAVERVVVPIPIVPTRHNISINRPHAEYRVTNGQPEFYMRVSGGAEPELELIRAVTRGDSRQVEKLDVLFGEQKLKKDEVAVQRWTIATNLYRYTLGTALAPGEYVLAEAIQDNGLELYLWDFGVDPPEGTATTKKK